MLYPLQRMIYLPYKTLQIGPLSLGRPFHHLTQDLKRKIHDLLVAICSLTVCFGNKHCPIINVVGEVTWKVLLQGGIRTKCTMAQRLTLWFIHKDAHM